MQIKKQGRNMVAEVIINSSVKTLNKVFDYQIPEALIDIVKIGSRVVVPFGQGSKMEEGFVVQIKPFSEYAIKEIVRVEEKQFLSQTAIQLAEWMAKRYFCNVADGIKLCLPPGTTSKQMDKRMKEKMVSFARLAKDKDVIQTEIEQGVIKSEKQKRALTFLMQNGEMLAQDLETLTDVSRSILKTLEKNGYILLEQKEVERNPLAHKTTEKQQKLVFNAEQQLAYTTIADAMDDGFFCEFLLFGVTGSGKTEVYLQLIEKALQEGKSSLVLVPEISLTPQTIDRFIARFGQEEIAVLHSKLSTGERYDSWQKIKRGDAHIIIGARSAVFAPIQNIGLIIIDEEQDNSYKSEMTPRYHTKEVARYIAQTEEIPLVLGSATPSLETYKKAEEGTIGLLTLHNRANNQTLPEVEIVDLRQELAHGNHSMLSRKLQEQIAENLQHHKQTILFLNRRGYATFIMCRECGYIATCKRCNISLTYHAKQNTLKCHYCGYQTPILHQCPECQSDTIRYFGTGTQKLEAQIRECFPTARVLRMDVDTVSKKNGHEEILEQFKKQEADILIGTQMVVKGHHFPNVTLVGVVAADSSLHIDDFRASETAFQLFTQVAGRAGRGEDAGKVLIQTYNPDHFVLELVKKQDYIAFYKTEILVRKQLKNPPFCDIIVIGVSDTDTKKAENVMLHLYQYLKQKIQTENIPIMVYKGIPAPVDKIKDRYRWRMIIKCMYTSEISQMLQEMLDKAYKETSGSTRIVADVNPSSMI